jgi:hypothetical protein
VVAAVAEGRFSVYAVSSVDEGIAILTGLPAGERGADGRFAAGSINARVEERLSGYADRGRAPGAGATERSTWRSRRKQ